MWNLQSCPITVLTERMCDILGVEIYSDPSYILSSGQDPNPSRIYAPAWCIPSLCILHSDGQTDRRTNRDGISISCVTQTRDENHRQQLSMYENSRIPQCLWLDLVKVSNRMSDHYCNKGSGGATGFCCPGQRSMVLQPATPPILSALNKLKININLR